MTSHERNFLYYLVDTYVEKYKKPPQLIGKELFFTEDFFCTTIYLTIAERSFLLKKYYEKAT